jgi:hypothetical protein
MPRKAKTIYEGFPEALTKAGYTQDLLSSIQRSPIENQDEFNKIVSYLKKYITSLIDLVKPDKFGRIGFKAENINSILRGTGRKVGAAIDVSKIIIGANQGRSNKISTEILLKFITKLPKKNFFDINGSNVESILSELATKNHSPKSSLVYEGFPKALIDAGYNQGLLSSIQRSPIENQDEFNKIVSSLEEYITSLIDLVKPDKFGRIGFNPKNISSILFCSGKMAGEAIVALTSKTDNLKALVDHGFTPTNISSILSSSGQGLGIAIDALTSKTDNLKALVDHGFTPTNISSILGSSGQNVGIAIDALTSKTDNLKALENHGFTPTNISSILSSSRQNVGIAIDTLTSKVDNLKPLLGKVSEGGLGFTATNISSILNGTGQNVGLGINALTSRVDKLQKLLTPVEDGEAGFTPTNICGILRGSGQNVGQAIDALIVIDFCNQNTTKISAKIVTKFLANLPKKELLNINSSNVESIFSKLEKTKLSDPSSQVSYADAPSSKETDNPFEGFGCHEGDYDDPTNYDTDKLSAGLGIDETVASSEKEQRPPEKMNPSRDSKRPPSDKLSQPNTKRGKSPT